MNTKKQAWIPDDIYCYIACFLNAKSLAMFSFCNKYLFHLLSSCWDNLIYHDFGPYYVVSKNLNGINKYKYIHDQNKKFIITKRKFNFEISPFDIEMSFQQLRVSKKDIIVIDNWPCKILQQKIAAKNKKNKNVCKYFTVFCKRLFTDETVKRDLMFFDKVIVPNINILEYELLDIVEDGDEHFLVLMDINENIRDDIKMPCGRINSIINEGFKKEKKVVVKIIQVMNEEEIFDVCIG